MRQFYYALGFVCFSVAAVAQSATVLKISFEREGVRVPHWEMRLDDDGSGMFESRPAGAAPVSREVRLSQKSWEHMRRLLEVSNHLVPCESRARNLARIGVKTVEWTTPEGSVARCSFNYTDNKALSQLAEIWSGMAATLEEGRRIAQLHKHDRLGLDKELSEYEHAVAQGFAVEPKLIEPELRALVEDEWVMERVRKRAQRLLDR
ncbi:MAG: hypothetical protein JSS87_03745 [Acidobacteria bacterium]|nr:hypothetical protein [Acidobacteriota bacterium]